MVRLAAPALCVLVVVLLDPLWTSPHGRAFAPGIVTLKPGDDIQAAVDRYPEGTTFVLGAGIYRLQSIVPRNRDVFRGELEAGGRRLTVLSGARRLTAFVREGPYWVAAGQTQHGQVHGACLPAHPRCGNPEDFFFDDRPFVHVARRRDLGPGRYFFDYIGHRIYFTDDPAGHTVETSVSRSAFHGPASNVTIQDLVIEKYAVPDQMGAIGDQQPGTGWTVENNEVRWNHGAGIFASTGARVLHNYVHDNGQLGIGGAGDDILVEGNEIASNRNYSGTDCGWECGGLKFSSTNRLTVRANRSHDNAGAGLWTDGDCINTLYEGNTVVANDVGIFHEISYRATIRHNTVLRNGEPAEGDLWLWNAQIQISTSQDVDIYGNTVEVDSRNNGNGIVLIQQDRRADGGRYGPYQTVNNHVHDNTITVTGTRAHGATGAAQDYDRPDIFAPSSRNRFDRNRYYVYDITRPGYWVWNNRELNWASFRARGQEANGFASSTRARRSPAGLPKVPPRR
jgi:parallel beta-helix repeat protein